MRPLPALGLLALSACTHIVPPAPAAPRAAMPVQASLGRTWDAVIEVFADRNIPIKTLERVSGFIATDDLGVGPEGRALADCGYESGTVVANGETPDTAHLSPNRVTYNVLVRGDSSAATVRVTTRWVYVSGSGRNPVQIECASRGVWEAAFEGDVKARAEGAAAAR